MYDILKINCKYPIHVDAAGRCYETAADIYLGNPFESAFMAARSKTHAIKTHWRVASQSLKLMSVQQELERSERCVSTVPQQLEMHLLLICTTVAGHLYPVLPTPCLMVLRALTRCFACTEPRFYTVASGHHWGRSL